MKYNRYDRGHGSCYRLVEVLGEQEVITRPIDLPLERRRRASLQDLQKLTPEALNNAKLLAPVTPSKIVCIGRNYREHAKELGNEPPSEPLIFLKPPSSLNGPGGAIRKPKISKRVDFEGELGVVISKTCSYMQGDEPVRPYILGYTC